MPQKAEAPKTSETPFPTREGPHVRLAFPQESDTREGLSRRYLKLGGRWRDHERWAILAEDWRARVRE